MKKFAIIGLTVLSLFANTNSLQVKQKIQKIFNNVGEKTFPGYKSSNVVFNQYDKKLQTYIGINRINAASDYDFMLYMYYPKAKAIQLLSPENFKMISDNSKTSYVYIDKTIKKVVKTFVLLKQEKEIRDAKKQKQIILSKTTKNNGVIFLSKDPNKDTILIFMDPNCPFCIQKIKNTNFAQLLKKFNVAIIPVPLVSLDKNNKVIRNRSLHPNALALSTDIISEIKPGMNYKEKVKIIEKNMKRYNNNNFKRIKDKAAREKVLKNYKDYLETNAIKGTPTVIRLSKKETRELLKRFN